MNQLKCQCSVFPKSRRKPISHLPSVVVKRGGSEKCGKNSTFPKALVASLVFSPRSSSRFLDMESFFKKKKKKKKGGVGGSELVKPVLARERRATKRERKNA